MDTLNKKLLKRRDLLKKGGTIGISLPLISSGCIHSNAESFKQISITNSDKRAEYINKNRAFYQDKQGKSLKLNLLDADLLGFNDSSSIALALLTYNANLAHDIDNIRKDLEELVKLDPKDKIFRELPSLKWIQSINAAQLKKVVQSKINERQLIWNRDKTKSFALYKSLYSEPYPKSITMMGQNEFISDKLFADLRVSGANPLLIKKVNGIRLGDEKKISGFVSSKLGMKWDELKENRLFVVDYNQYLAGLADKGAFTHGLTLSTPLVYFYLSKQNRLDVLAITYPNGKTLLPDSSIAWEFAKMESQGADAVHHELISHLSHTHLVIEPVLAATERNLYYMHPLYLLLRPHFEGTAFINNAADTSLISKNGSIDKIFANRIEDIQNFVVQAGMGAYNFNKAMLPQELKGRGIDLDNLAYYPYAEDSLALWSHIFDWVDSYLSYYYKNDAMITGDKELQNWVNEIAASLGGINDPYKKGNLKVNSVKYLVEMSTHIIFTASVQHAAVNFSQFDLLSFMPLANFGLHKDPSLVASEQNYWDKLQDYKVQIEQHNILVVLSAVKHTTLGRYDWIYDNGKEIRGVSLNDLVKEDAHLEKALNTFRSGLMAVEDTIKNRNASIKQGQSSLVMPYEYLIPSMIPQSINI